MWIMVEHICLYLKVNTEKGNEVREKICMENMTHFYLDKLQARKIYLGKFKFWLFNFKK